MKSILSITALLALGLASIVGAWVTVPPAAVSRSTTCRRCNTPPLLFMSESSPASSSSNNNTPTTFREAEVLGLRLMQEGNHEQALVIFQKGMKLPGSRPDVIRTKMLPGPSPVGGSSGGTDSEAVYGLDEFELQAAHYNMACAHAQLGNIQDSVANLKLAFDNGFDNFATVRGDPDLAKLKGTAAFDNLMNTVDPPKKMGLPSFQAPSFPTPSLPNPFGGLFGKKQ